MTQEDEKDPLKSLLSELADVDSLLSSAISKANHLEKNPRLSKYSDITQASLSNKSQVNQSNTVSKPSNWGQLKDMALEDSINAMEEAQNELAKDTTKVRTIKPKSKKLRIDDNWEDDPI